MMKSAEANSADSMSSRSPLSKITGNEASNGGSRLSSGDGKRSSQTLEYPKAVAVPSRGLVQALYQEAIEHGSGDQRELSDAGLLSLEEVLLPAIAHQEEQPLKTLQAKVQRDKPDLTSTVVACRKAVYDSVGAAIQAATQSRQARKPAQETAKLQWDKEREEEQRRQEEYLASSRKIQREKRIRELKKKSPRNQELWREVAYLMTEMGKLEKEERLWKEAEKDLVQREQDMKVREQEKQSQDDKMDVDEDAMIDSKPSEEFTKFEQSVEDITLSTIRIQQALKIVSGIITDSDQVRKDLYHRYRQDHQFHGYQGVKDPKGLLRALSQSQDVE